MKRTTLIIVSIFVGVFSGFAQNIKSDSLAYELQRTKINGMLLQRKVRFGQYDQSVSKHSGIFWMQTKKDIRRSNDILTEIINNDDEIFRQIKILLDYKTFQQKKVVNQVVTKSIEMENREIELRNTIEKLKSQVVLLQQASAQKEKEYSSGLRICAAVMVLMLASIFFLFLRKRRV
jgi:hypothetical protein